jgi:hypothetical protein
MPIAVEGGRHRRPTPTSSPAPEAETERIFHHTVVDEQFGGRGLSKVLVAEGARRLPGAWHHRRADLPRCSSRSSSRPGMTIRPRGGRFRNATGADFDIVKKQA